MKVNKVDEVMNKISELIEQANAELGKFVGEPFSMEEVKVSAENDSAAIYIHSGKTPVCAVVRAGDIAAVVREAKAAVDDIVERTRTAIERRGGTCAEAETLARESSERDKAVEAMKASGLPTELVIGVAPGTAEAILASARKAVRKVNRGIGLSYNGAHECLGGYRGMRLSVRGYSCGLVVLAGGKPCLVTRYPKIGSVKTLKRTMAFLESDIEAIGESRRRFFDLVAKRHEREERLRELARRIDSAEGALASMMG